MSNFQFIVIEEAGSSIRFFVKESGARISHQRFLDLLKNNPGFREQYNNYLADCGFDAFFWENMPITKQTLHKDYECNLINSDFLSGCLPDSSTFQSYFRNDKAVVRFPNLGKDAQLVVPCPVNEHSVYTHIGTFVRNAGAGQKDEFWKHVGKETLNQIGEEPRWLSTSGLGVFWLHVRIDSYPKYYQTEEYKTL
jgi:hypothetical protein